MTRPSGIRIKHWETEQRAELGGYPLCNETAHRLGFGHGDSVLIVSTRHLVAFLKRAQRGNAYFQQEVAAMLREWDKFAFEVEPDEGVDPTPAPPPKLALLRALLDGDRHGIELLDRVREQTRGTIALGQRNAYPMLRALERQGLVASYEGPPLAERANRPRRYYRLTEEGRRQAQAA